VTPTESAKPWTCPSCGRETWHLYALGGICKQCLKKLAGPEGPNGKRRNMDKVKLFWQTFLRFGPLVAGALLALVAAPFIGDSAAEILKSAISVLGTLGIQPDQEAAALFGEGAAALVLLLGIVRKLLSIFAKYQEKPARKSRR
jgi:hypothetical protein